MNFFSEWLITRLQEGGWPKKEGVFKKRHYYTEDSIIRSMQDVVRIALALGAGLPDDAKGIAITYNAITPHTTKTDITNWIALGSDRGSKKWEGRPADLAHSSLPC